MHSRQPLFLKGILDFKNLINWQILSIKLEKLIFLHRYTTNKWEKFQPLFFGKINQKILRVFAGMLLSLL